MKKIRISVYLLIGQGVRIFKAAISLHKAYMQLISEVCSEIIFSNRPYIVFNQTRRYATYYMWTSLLAQIEFIKYRPILCVTSLQGNVGTDNLYVNLLYQLYYVFGQLFIQEGLLIYATKVFYQMLIYAPKAYTWSRK